MVLTDLVLLVSVMAGFVVICLNRTTVKSRLLLVIALVILINTVLGLSQNRWQNGFGILPAFMVLAIIPVIRIDGYPAMAIRFFSYAGFVLSAIVLCAVIYFYPLSKLPQPTGPFSVGTTRFELSDPSRQSEDSDGSQLYRRLAVRAWYPSSDKSDGWGEAYFSDIEAKSTALSLVHILDYPGLNHALRFVRTNSNLNASVSVRSERLPVVLISHGFGLFPQQNTVLAEQLASHGYVVIGIQHTFDSSATVFPNGDILPMSQDAIRELESTPPVNFSFSDDPGTRLTARLHMQKQYIEQGSRMVTQSARTWVDDQKFVLDQLQSGPISSAAIDLSNVVDFSKVAIIGMSFGGSAAGAFCAMDNRCALGVNMDGIDMHLNTINKDIDKPFLMLHADLESFANTFGAPVDSNITSFNEFSYSSFSLSGGGDQVRRIEIKGMKHIAFTDFGLFVRHPHREKVVGSLAPGLGLNIQNDLILAFLDDYFKPSSIPRLDSLLKLHEDRVGELETDQVRNWWNSLSPVEQERVKFEISRSRTSLSD